MMRWAEDISNQTLLDLTHNLIVFLQTEYSIDAVAFSDVSLFRFAQGSTGHETHKQPNTLPEFPIALEKVTQNKK